ncbi:MAG: thioredoxin family protein [Rhodothermales bacterium]
MSTIMGFDINARMNDGLSYEDYLRTWEVHIAKPLKGLDKQARKNLFYAKYNAERAGRVVEAYQMDQKLEKLIDSVASEQHWMVLTEDWCVDSAYALPIISNAASRNRYINMRILLRDENLDIMDQYLTDGGRSIPKLVVFGADGTELYQWGPRPQSLKQQREIWKADGVEGPMLSQKGAEWYDAGGWRDVETELIDTFANSEVFV